MKQFTFMTAPMEDISDNAFRTLCYSLGADLTFTEMIKIDGLARQNENTWQRLKTYDETPVIIQLLGDNEKKLKDFLKQFKPPKGFKGFNLNIGCPNPQVTKQGMGAAMVARVGRTKDLCIAIKKYGYHVSIKMRLGMTEEEKQNKVYLKLIDAVDADFFVVHPRIAPQGYGTPPDYEALKECVATGKQIIANGDIDSIEKFNIVNSMGVHGVMIGRAAVKNPGIFNEIKGIKNPSRDEIRNEYIRLSDNFKEAFRYRKNFLKHFDNEIRYSNKE